MTTHMRTLAILALAALSLPALAQDVKAVEPNRGGDVDLSSQDPKVAARRFTNEWTCIQPRPQFYALDAASEFTQITLRKNGREFDLDWKAKRPRSASHKYTT